MLISSEARKCVPVTCLHSRQNWGSHTVYGKTQSTGCAKYDCNSGVALAPGSWIQASRAVPLKKPLGGWGAIGSMCFSMVNNLRKERELRSC